MPINKFLKTCLFTPAVLARFGTLSPERVKIPEDKLYIHINPRDKRARKKLIYDFARQRTTQHRRFWRDAVAHLQPDLALDIGVNYGECLFSARYPHKTQAVGVEANPDLIPILEKSRQEHPDRSRIKIVNALAADHPDDNSPFYLNRDWSGGSTAVREIAGTSPHKIETINIRATTIDELLNTEPSAMISVLVFKIDVEGFEPMVLTGMSSTLTTCRHALGYIEVNTRFVEKSGWALPNYSRLLRSFFDLYIPLERDNFRLRKINGLAELADYSKDKEYPCSDIIAVKGFDDLSWLAPGWDVL